MNRTSNQISAMKPSDSFDSAEEFAADEPVSKEQDES